MKKLFVFTFLFLSFFSVKAEMLDVDYNFIDTAFDGIKPVTNKEFDDTINRLTPQPIDDSFGGKLKAFLFGRKYGVNPTPVQQNAQEEYGGEKEAIENLKNGVQYITLYASIIGNGGEIIPVGNYKIQEKIIKNEPNLIFYQGHKECGTLKLRKFEDNLKNENDIVYSRVDIVNDEIIRIVYATISDTKCALAKVHLQN